MLASGHQALSSGLLPVDDTATGAADDESDDEDRAAADRRLMASVISAALVRHGDLKRTLSMHG